MDLHLRRSQRSLFDVPCGSRQHLPWLISGHPAGSVVSAPVTQPGDNEYGPNPHRGALNDRPKPERPVFHASSASCRGTTRNTSNSCTRATPTTRARWMKLAGVLRQMGDDEVSVKREAEGPSWARADWPPQPADDLTAALTGEWAPEPEEAKDAGEKIKEEGRRKGRRGFRRPDQARGARQHPRADDDPRLPDPRPPWWPTRPAGHARPDPAPGAGPEILRASPMPTWIADLHRQRAGPAGRVDAPDHRDRETHLLRHLCAAIHAHLRPRTSRLAEGADRGLRQGNRLHPRRAQGDPEQAGRGRRASKSSCTSNTWAPSALVSMAAKR